MSRLRGELDREAARVGGRIWSYEPQGSRGRDAGGRPIFDTLAPVREFVFWVASSCGGINCSSGTATPCCLGSRDGVSIMVSPNEPAYIPHESGIGGYRVSLVKREKS